MGTTPNSLTTKKQTKNFHLQIFKKILSPNCIILRIQRLGANSADLDEVAHLDLRCLHHEPPHLDPGCLQIQLFSPPVLKQLIEWNCSFKVHIFSFKCRQLGKREATIFPCYSDLPWMCIHTCPLSTQWLNQHWTKDDSMCHNIELLFQYCVHARCSYSPVHARCSYSPTKAEDRLSDNVVHIISWKWYWFNSKVHKQLKASIVISAWP